MSLSPFELPISSRLSHIAFVTASRADRADAPALTRAGRFDARAIMRRAIQTARTLKRGGRAWSYCMAIGLRDAWKRARAELAACLAPMPVRIPVPVLRPAERRPAPVAVRTFDRGSPVHSHGW